MPTPTSSSSRRAALAALSVTTVAVAGIAPVILPASAFAAEEKPPAAAPVAEAKAAAEPAKDAKVTLAFKAKAGQVLRRKSEGSLKVEAGGMTAPLEVKETGKLTVVSVAPNGDVTLEHETESSEASINGQKMPDDADSKDKETITIRPDGTLVAFKSTADDKDQGKLSARMYVATTPVFTDKPVGVGDTWSREFKADSGMGTEAGRGDYEVVAREKKAGVDAVKIKLRFAESGVTPTITAEGFVWVEAASGDPVATEIDVANVPLGSGANRALVAGKLREERTEGGPLTGAASAEKKEKTIDEVVKDFKKLPGIVTLYQKRDGGRDTLYAELREDQLDTLMMLQATASTGTAEQIVAGDPINDLVFKFVRSGDEKITMVTPNIAFRADDKKPIARAVRRSFADAYLESFKVEAKQAERKSLLINVSDLFRGDIAQISRAFAAAGGGYAMDREKTYVVKVANFPDNLAVETQYHFTKGGGGPQGLFGGGTLADPRSAPIRVRYNLFMLPTNGYRPRLADGRVGYFVTEYQNFDDDSRDDQIVRYIYRWNVEKADPSARLSPPKKPITFWLDNAIPTEYRACLLYTST